MPLEQLKTCGKKAEMVFEILRFYVILKPINFIAIRFRIQVCAKEDMEV